MRTLSFVHVCDFAICASIMGRHCVMRSWTGSAAQRTDNSDSDTTRAYNVLKLIGAMVRRGKQTKKRGAVNGYGPTVVHVRETNSGDSNALYI